MTIHAKSAVEFFPWDDYQRLDSIPSLKLGIRKSAHNSPSQAPYEPHNNDISSSDLRQRAAQGHSLRYLVPRAVGCYIETHHLYQSVVRSP